MPTYEYECGKCSLRFEQQQSINDAPLQACPKCKGKVQRIISGGSGFIMKSSKQSPSNSRQGCSLEETGKTCCGATQRCGESHCGD